jgi:hypothetical protein
MRITSYVVALALLSVGVARAQQPPPEYPPPQYQNQPPYPPPQYPPQYAQPVQPNNPLNDPRVFAQWERLRNKSHKLRLGGKVSLGVGIPLLVIGMSVGIVAVYNNGVYLCSGIACDRTAAAAAGFTLGVIGVAGLGAGIAMLVLANRYYDQSERVRLGMELASWMPSVAPLTRTDGHGVDGAAIAWAHRF